MMDLYNQNANAPFDQIKDMRSSEGRRNGRYPCVACVYDLTCRRLLWCVEVNVDAACV